MPQHLRGLAVLSAVFACLCYLLSLSVHPVAEKEAPTYSAWQNDDLPLLNRQRRDTCGSLDCMNGGTCNTTGPTPVCSCPKPYSGTNCSDVDNYCEKVQPEKGINNLPICLNGGGCTPRNWDPYFDCTCIINSTGIRCETFVACFYHNPCVNGLCINTASAPNCSCFAGWTDAQCSTDVDDCHSRPCQNGGICIDGNSTFTCDCTSTDYSGATCSDRINDCQPDPCLNGGTCVDGLRSYTCTCVDGYSGRNCSIDHPDCSPNPCVDNATCLERSIKHLYGIPSLPAPFNGHFRYSLAAGFVCDKGHADELPPDSNSGMGIGIAVGFAICSVLAVAIFLLVLWGYKQRKLSLGFFSRMDSKYAANNENSHSHVAETHIDGLRSTEMLHSVGSSANRNGVAVANDRETYVDMSQNVRSDISSDYVRPSELGRHMSSVYISPTSAEALGTGNARATQDETYEMPNANINQPTIELFATAGANSAQSQSTALPAVDEEGAESDGSDKIYTMADVSPGEQRIDASKDSKMEKKSSSKEKPKCSLESTLAAAGSLPSLSAAAGTSTLGAGEPQAPQQRLAVSQTEPNLSSNPPSTKPRKPAKPANWRQQQQPPARPTRSPGSENSQQQQPSSTGTTSTETAEAAGTQAVENAETVYDTIEYGSFEGSIPQQQSQQARTALPAKIDPTKLGSFEKFK